MTLTHTGGLQGTSQGPNTCMSISQLMGTPGKCALVTMLQAGTDTL